MREIRARCGPLAALLFAGASMAFGAEKGVEIEYVGHACFVLQSPAGVRLAIDPYNGKRWLGFDFPDDVRADAVLVSHPHYDHDASYYFGARVPVFREPGRYAIGDVSVQGLKGRHAGSYGRDFEQKNTIWLVEAGGLRLAHLGDNGPLTAENAEMLGRVDVLFLPADGEDHILTPGESDAIRGALRPTVVVPMHYRLDGFLGLPTSLGPIDPWLAKQRNVTRLGAHRTSLGAPLEGDPRVVVFDPSPALRVWPDALAEAWRKLDEARALLAGDESARAQAAALVREAHQSGDGIVFAFQWARALHQSGRSEEAVSVLEAALGRAARGDWEYRMRARSLLAELYHAQALEREAAEQHRIVLENAYRTELLEKARSYLSGQSR